MTYDFDERLAFSQGRRIKSDIELLQKIIPSCVSIAKTDVNIDKQGIDYVAKLQGGAEIAIDVKTREKGASRFWKKGEPELALETWSVCPECQNGMVTGTRGWTLSDKTNVDFILYTFDVADTDRFYFLPYQLLRMAFLHNGTNWIKQYPLKRQTSNSWQSEALFIPASIVLDAIRAEMQCMLRGSDKH